MRDVLARLQLPRIALTVAKAALFALPGAAAMTAIFVALGLTGPLGDPLSFTRLDGRIASIAAGTRPLIPVCSERICNETGFGVLKEYRLGLVGVGSEYEIHPTELRPRFPELTSTQRGEEVSLFLESGTSNVMGLELQGRRYESFAMRHPELRSLWQALFMVIAFEISFLVTLPFVAARNTGRSGGSRRDRSGGLTEGMLLALAANYAVTWTEYFRLHGFLGGPVGYGHLATALNILWLALGLGAVAEIPAGLYEQPRRLRGHWYRTSTVVGLASGLAVTLLTAVLPFELLVWIDAR